MADNEHTLASLGQAEELSVQAAVGPPVPEFPQAPEEGSKIPSVPRGTDSRHVLPDNPCRPFASHQSKKDEGQVATGIGQSAPETGDREALARCSPDKKVN